MCVKWERELYLGDHNKSAGDLGQPGTGSAASLLYLVTFVAQPLVGFRFYCPLKSENNKTSNRVHVVGISVILLARPLVRNPEELCQNLLPGTHFPRILPYLRCHDKTTLITTSPTVQNVPCSWRPFVNLWFGHHVPCILCPLSETPSVWNVLGVYNFCTLRTDKGAVLNSKGRYDQGRNNIASLFADVLPTCLSQFPLSLGGICMWPAGEFFSITYLIMFNVLLYACVSFRSKIETVPALATILKYRHTKWKNISGNNKILFASSFCIAKTAIFTSNIIFQSNRKKIF
jgi:hypothetical protein